MLKPTAYTPVSRLTPGYSSYIISPFPPPLSPPFTLFWVKGPQGALALPSFQTSNIPSLTHVFTLARHSPPHRIYAEEM